MMRVPFVFLAVAILQPCLMSAEPGRLSAEPKWWLQKANYNKTFEKLQQDYRKLPDYVAAMKAVHAKFKGTPGTIAMFGASQTQSAGFWSPLADKSLQKNMSPQMQKDYDLVNSHIKSECWKWKGFRFGNSGGQTAEWVRDTACEEVLKRLNPEVVVILIGQQEMDRQLKNDGQYAEWKTQLTQACRKCLDNGSIVIMSTFPPRASRRADVANEGILEIAAQLKVPVTDWGGECLKRSPTGWNGGDPAVWAKYNYTPKGKLSPLEVPTLICFDGQHASYPSKYINDWSEESLRCSGDNLRTYITLTVYADVLRKVIGVPQPPAGK